MLARTACEGELGTTQSCDDIRIAWEVMMVYAKPGIMDCSNRVDEHVHRCHATV